GDPSNQAWRYTLMTGLIPAIPIALLLPFVPESAVWLERKRTGTLKRPSFAEIFAPGLIRTTLVATALSACADAAAFGTLQVTVRQGVPGLPDLKDARDRMAPFVEENKALAKEMRDLRKELKDLRKESSEYAEKEKKYAEKEKKFNANLKQIG